MAAKKKSKAKKKKKAAPRLSKWERELADVPLAAPAHQAVDHGKCIAALSKATKSLATILMQMQQEQTEGSLRDAGLERLREVVVTCRKVGDFYGVEEEKARPTALV